MKRPFHPRLHMPTHVTTITILLLAVLLSSGCALQPPAPVAVSIPAPIVREPSAAERLLTELARLQRLSPAALAETREAAREVFERDPAMFRRMQYAMTIFVAPTSPGDDDRLLGLVEPVLNTTQAVDEASRVVALLAYTSAASRKKIRDDATTVRRTNVTAKRDDREPEVRALKQRVDELEKQLLALKSIDRSVSHR
jgi:sirohydrochlorin ferrochelatase